MTDTHWVSQELRELDDELAAAVELPPVDTVIRQAGRTARASTAAAAAVLTVGALGGVTAVTHVGDPASVADAAPVSVEAAAPPSHQHDHHGPDHGVRGRTGRADGDHDAASAPPDHRRPASSRGARPGAPGHLHPADDAHDDDTTSVTPTSTTKKNAGSSNNSREGAADAASSTQPPPARRTASRGRPGRRPRSG